jgi:extracellular factor (EF) 3-hydroxypalmitic acid methyl ester biosynthesis protein
MQNTLNSPHENFDVTKKSRSEPVSKLVRQQRFLPEEDVCYLTIRGQEYPVVDYSAFGVAIRADNALTQEELQDIPFTYDGVEAAHLDIRPVRQHTDEQGESIIAFEIVNDPIHFDKLEAIRAGRKIISQQQQYGDELNSVPGNVKAKVYEIKDWLEQLARSVEALEETFAYTNQNSIREFEETVASMVAQYLGTIFSTQLRSFADHIKGLDEDQCQRSIAFLRDKLSHLIHQSPFAERVYHKPLGYAGDFEMMNLIYRQETVGRSLFARCLQRYYIDEPAAQAVRNRADYLMSVISPLLHETNEEPARILSVACGPAMEWQKLMATQSAWTRAAKVDLLDQDEQALHYAQMQLRRLNRSYSVDIDFNYVHAAIKNVIARGINNDSYDLIYSAGLFDYLSDSVARKAAQSLYNALRPGGALIIGNFNVNNPTTLVMEYALDWELIYRSPADLHRLFDDIGDDIDIEEEPLGINLFCVIKKS